MSIDPRNPADKMAASELVAPAPVDRLDPRALTWVGAYPTEYGERAIDRAERLLAGIRELVREVAP